LTDNAALMKRSDSHATRGTTPAVPAKVKLAVEILLNEPGEIDYAKLAERVGYCSAAELRRWLNKPQSVRYQRDRKRERLEQTNLGNPEAMRRVRDGGNAMASVQAARTLEGMARDMDEASGARASLPAPGVVIVIEAPDGRAVHTLGPPSPVIEGKVVDAELPA
jgi:hypothetical protein